MTHTIVISILDRLGFKTVSPEYYDLLDTWKSWYECNVEKFHSYQVDTGIQKLNVKRYSAGMAKQVCEDWADLLMNEKVSIAIGGDKETEFVEQVLEDNSWDIKSNEAQETKGYCGTVAYVPHVVGAVLDGKGVPTGEAEGIVIDYIPAPQIFPLSWTNGKIKEVAFVQSVKNNKKQYIYMQIHKLGQDKQYEILNSLYEINGSTPTEVPLATLPDYENIPYVIYTHSAAPQFVIDKYAIKSNSKSTGPMGIAVFANAIDQLKAVDIAYDSYVNEFILGKKRVMVKLEALKNLDGEPVFDTNEMVFYALPEDSASETMIKELDMSLRTEQHSRGIQDLLHILSHKTGLGNDFYKFDGGSVKTATEVISANSKLFRTMKKHEIVLNSAIIDLVRIILRLGNLYFGQNFNVDTDVTVNFDDSIIEDTESEFKRDTQLVSLGVMERWELRARYLGESPEEAKKNLPKLDAMTEAPEEE